jgi:hypothetical protein
VVAAVRFARDHDLKIAIRGGGHNVAGNAVCDGGVVIDLSPMHSVRVDPSAQTVRAEGGVTIGELDHETQAFGLAVPMGVVTATGIAGLTLGGGLGWLRRKYGLSCDNLRSADVVTADGRLVTASADADAELLWALKGGGGNFGIVTSLEFQAYPVGPDVFFAFVVHAGPDARAALRFFRAWDASAPDEVSAFAILWHAPEIDEIPAEHHHAPIAVYLAMHCGDPTDGERVLRPLREFGTPIADLSAPMPYLDVQRFFDADYPAHEMRYYWKSRYLSGLPDEAIDVLVELNEATPSSHSTLDVWQQGGRMSRVAPAETALGDRSAPPFPRRLANRGLARRKRRFGVLPLRCCRTRAVPATRARGAGIRTRVPLGRYRRPTTSAEPARASGDVVGAIRLLDELLLQHDREPILARTIPTY